MRLSVILGIGSLLFLGMAHPSFAHPDVRSKISFESTRAASISSEDLPSESTKKYMSRRRLGGESDATIITAPRWRYLAKHIHTKLAETYKEYQEMLGKIPSTSTIVRVVPKEEFHAMLNLPLWTNAIFFRGEIIIPVSTEGTIDLEELGRSVKHEFVHALIHELGNNQVPGWLDEGLAQWSEGTVHASLPILLKNWLSNNRFIPFEQLSRGFTKLEDRKVPVAYAQSLFSAKEIIRRFGFKGLSKYFRLLRQGMRHRAAFQASFGEPLNVFQAKTEKAVRRRLSR